MKSKEPNIMSGITLLIFGVIIAFFIVSTTVNPLCTYRPYDSNCVCPEGFRKVGEWSDELGKYRFKCVKEIEEENYSFPMNYNDEHFKEKALKYAKDVIREKCPNCDTVECSGTAWLSSISTMSEGNSKIPKWGYVECKEQIGESGGVYWWRIVFSLEDGRTHPYLESYCKDSNGRICEVDIR